MDNSLAIYTDTDLDRIIESGENPPAQTARFVKERDRRAGTNSKQASLQPQASARPSHELWTAFITHLYRGGEFGHYWQLQGKAAQWFKADAIDARPTTSKDWYFGVHPVKAIPTHNRKGKLTRPEAVRSQLSHIAAINCLFGDFDSKGQNGSKAATLAHVEGLPVAPSVIIDSGGGFHCYWLLDSPVFVTDENRETVESVQARWVDLVGSDKGAKDTARVLRIVGTRNLKAKYGPDFPVVRFVKCDLGQVYPLADLVNLLPDPEPIAPPVVATSPVILADDAGSGDRRARYWAQAVSVAVEMIANAPDGDKHGVLLQAARLLGGFVAGGMGDGSVARDVLETAIRDKPNVASMAAAISTIDDGLEYGKAHPITYEQKEGERQAWLAAHPLTVEQPPVALVAPPVEGDDVAGVDLPGGDVAQDAPPAEKPNIPQMALCAPLPESAQLAPELARDACRWLDEYTSFSRHWSPRAYDGFHEACGLALLSTIAARRVALHFGGVRFPSLYITLTARTSLFAKTTTAMIARQVLDDLGLGYFLAPDDSTPQAFIKSLTGKLPDDFDRLPQDRRTAITRRLALRASRGWFYEEFGQKLAQMMRPGGFMADFRGHLRRFDDAPSRYEYTTIGRGTDLVERPYLALLANMTPADMRGCGKRGSALWGDGFFARFAFVTPDGATSNTARFPSGERVISETVKRPLLEWHRRLGLPVVSISDAPGSEGDDNDDKQPPMVYVEDTEPTFCTLGAGVVDAFYNYHDALVGIASVAENDDFDGNYARFAEKALRVAMLFASLENDNAIELCHWAKAQEIAERWRRGLHSLYEQVTESETTEAETHEDKILLLVSKKTWATARQVAQGVRGVDTASARIILDSLVGDVLIKARKKSNKTDVYAVAGTALESRP